MKLLVLGGTAFLSRAVADEAIARDHDVTCACRGSSAPPEGATFVAWDRTQPVPSALAAGGFDAVVDIARHPSRVRSAAEALPDAHWVFVSTISVYADQSDPSGPGTGRLLDAVYDDADTQPAAYGGMKVACEESAAAAAHSLTIVRPGLIAGPGDPTGRFTYWPVRLAEGGTVLAPGSPDSLVQVIDVRDLAAWIVTLAESRTAGVFDAVGIPLPMADFLAACEAGVRRGEAPRWHWMEQSRLEELGVQPWVGDGSIPVWLPRPEYDGMLSHDPAPALAAGLTLRPLSDTSRDTLAWFEDSASPALTGISRAREAELLAAD